MSKKPFEQKTGLGKFLTFKWVGKIFSHVDDKLIDAAVKITEGVKRILDSPIADWVTSAIPGDLDDKIVEWARPELAKIVASNLLLKNVIDDPTEENMKELAESIRIAFGGKTDDEKGKFFTNVAGDLGKFFHDQAGTKITFGEAAAEAEILWQELQKLKNG